MSEDPGKSNIKADRPNTKEVNYNYDKTKVVFSDMVQIIVSPETVSLDFAQRSRKSKDEVNVTHSMVITIPHFIRLVEASQNLAKPIVENMKKFQKKQQEK